MVSGWTHPDRAIRRSVGRSVDACCKRLSKRTTPDFIGAFGQLPRLQKVESVAVVAKHARVERSTVYRWIERYLAERAPSALADGKRSGRPRTTPALTDAKLRQLLTSDPCQFGYDANTWTVPLLATHLHTGRCDQCPYTAAPDSRCPLPLEASRYVDSERAAHVGAKKGAWSDG
jgi:hypothetical protein